MGKTVRDNVNAKFKQDKISWEELLEQYPKYRLYCSEPKWYRKLFKHRKRRAALKKYLNKVCKDVNECDNIVQPLDKKPWIYYW